MTRQSLQSILQHLRTLTPDPSYARTSRRLLLQEIAREQRSWWNGFLFGVKVLSATGLAALAVAAFLGTIPFSSPSPTLTKPILSSLDLDGIQAEAEAVDIQIQLTSLQYDTPAEVVPPPQTAPQLSHSADQQHSLRSPSAPQEDNTPPSSAQFRVEDIASFPADQQINQALNSLIQ
ncbi:hypothetical protein D6779_01965 [Candidatus Parcubacteria bacterium]|nr:MAG: hypothetical protein D6779_01965 [Candidatus Parcubacteria bacterium]